MKKKFYIPIFFLLLFASCQIDDGVNDDLGNSERQPALNASLQEKFSYVVSHEGSFDDTIDNSSCFSVDFPYNLIVNGMAMNISSVQQASQFSEEDTIEIQYPINITYFDYSQVAVSSETQLEELANMCVLPATLINLSKCVSVKYPLELSFYNAESSTFNTLSFSNDKDVFNAIVTIEPEVLMSINYPVVLKDGQGNLKDIRNNDELIDYLSAASSGC